MSDIPTGLPSAVKSLARELRDKLKRYKGWSMHHPKEWNGQYGRDSELVVYYEGSDAAQYFSMDFCYDHGIEQYKPYEQMISWLNERGYYFEECTRQYCAIYEQ